MLRSRLDRALWHKRPRVSRDARVCGGSFFDFERWAGSGFKPLKRNDGGEGSVKKERSTGVRDDQRTCYSGTLY